LRELAAPLRQGNFPSHTQTSSGAVVIRIDAAKIGLSKVIWKRSSPFSNSTCV
jgi:hypothetical protein